MRISQRGLYALQAVTMLARRRRESTVKVRDIAEEEELPPKFLELILIQLKQAGIVESVRGNRGGYRLRREPTDIRLSDVIRLIDGPLAPFADAEKLRDLIGRDPKHRALFQVFLDVRNAVVEILEKTTVADITKRKAQGRW